MKKIINYIKCIINNYLTSGISEKYNIDINRKIKLINIIGLTGILTMIPLGIIAFFKGNVFLGLYANITAVVTIFILIYLRRSGNYKFSSYLGVFVAGFYLLYLFITGGISNTGHLWFFIFPLLTTFILGSKKGAIVVIMFVLLAILFFIIDYKSQYLATYTFDFKIRFLSAFFIVFVCSYFFEKIREKTEYKLSLKNIHLKEIIGELKKTDDKLLKAQNELEIKVKERTKELIMANIQLKNEIKVRESTEYEQHRLENQLIQAKKMEAIGTLAGGVAHDLNNILAGLVSYPDLLLMDIPKDSPLREPIITIKKSGERAAVIVQDLLTLARRSVVFTKIVNLNEIITEYLKSPEYKKLKSYNPDIRLITFLNPELLDIKGSPVHLTKTIMNLISNASEAMPNGGELHIRTENQYIDRTIKGYNDVTEGDYAVVTISDTGIGISPENVDRIFEPFYSKKVIGRSGTGLGMTVVWGTVKDHNGYIDVQSLEGKGTTFKLYFPVTRHVLSDRKIHLSVKECMGKKEKILVIDDIEEQKDVASAMLKKIGYNVSTVSSGEEALEYLKNFKVDLIVLDMIMDPGIDGLETYKKIISLHPGQKAIIVSGYSESEYVKEAQQLGAGTYVQKPYLLEKLAIAVRIELDKS